MFFIASFIHFPASVKRWHCFVFSAKALFCAIYFCFRGPQLRKKLEKAYAEWYIKMYANMQHIVYTKR